MGKLLLGLWVLVLAAIPLQGCAWLLSDCKPEAAEIAAQNLLRAKAECAEHWPAIESGAICKPDQPCPQCPLLEEGDKAIDKVCKQ